jgi:hypothetical protein
MQEIWKDIKGFEGYFQVSNFGRIKSLERKKEYSNRKTEEIIKEKFLSICDNGNGYKVVYLKMNGKKKSKYVHRLVAEAFIENPNKLKEINHKDFNKNNNNVKNLEWVDRKANITHYRGSNRYDDCMNLRNKKLKVKSLNRLKKFEKEVCTLYLEGNTIYEINKLTGLGKSKIALIIDENKIRRNNKFKITAVKANEEYIFNDWDSVIDWIKNKCNSIATLDNIKKEIRRSNKYKVKRYGCYWCINKSFEYLNK